MNLTGLDKHSATGHDLLDTSETVEAHSEFERWVSSVARWLTTVAPDAGLSSEWLSLPHSPLVVGSFYYDEAPAWAGYRSAIRKRLAWLGQLPGRAQELEASVTSTGQTVAQKQGLNQVSLSATPRPYVSPVRLEELNKIANADFDLAKLIRMCEELNVCFAGECYFAVAMLTRALIDHVPPVFGCGKFSEVSNSYARGSKSFKESMQNLANSSRKIADQHLHCQIRQGESLPTARQVDFGNDIDLLLGEIARVLRKT